MIDVCNEHKSQGEKLDKQGEKIDQILLKLEKLDKMEQKLDKVEALLVGDLDGKTGIISKVNDQEKKIKLIYIVVGFISFTSGAVGSAAGSEILKAILAAIVS